MVLGEMAETQSISSHQPQVASSPMINPNVFSSIPSVRSASGIRSYSSQIDDLKNEEIQVILGKYNTELARLQLENELFEKFVAHAGIKPTSSIGTIPLAPSHIDAFGSRTNVPHHSSTVSVREGTSLSSHRSTVRYTQQKLNIPLRMELLLHEMESLKVKLEQCQNECKTKKFKIKTEIEEKDITLQEIRLALLTLRQNVIGEATVDHMSVRVPAEKFLRYINDVLKNYDHNLMKMRMKINTMTSHIARIKVQLAQKVELGETIYPVDFEELKIENKDSAKDLEEKNKNLLALKKVTGFCSQNLNVKKRYLDELLVRFNEIANLIVGKGKDTIMLNSEGDKTNGEVLKAMEEFKSIKDFVTQFRAPSIMEYAKKKTQLRELERSIKIWNRRITLQNTTITLLRHKVKSISTCELKKSWIK